MKYKKLFLGMIILCVFSACSSEDDANSENTDYTYFLSDIRPRFFEQLDFNSQEKIKEIPNFLADFTSTYNQLESEYQEGKFSSQSDLENLRLTSEYYSFTMLALVRAYMDGILTMQDIVGNRIDFFSDVSPDSENFEIEELKSMMARAEEVSYFAVHLNGYNDRAYGFFLAVRQVRERLLNEDFTNDPLAQDALIYYSNQDINDYTIISNWNILMSMVTLNNYSDPLNTFQYPKMNILFSSANRRLIPGSLGDLNDRYPVILGPMYRFDLLMKKTDHIIHSGTELTDQEIAALDQYINGLVQISGFIENDQSQLLDSWEFKETFFQRKEKMQEIQTYFNAINNQEPPMIIPELSSFFKSRDFNQAYQCYSCHQLPNR